MTFNHKFSKGFTLVEVLIASAISAIAIGAATTFFYQTVVGHHIVDQRITQAGIVRRFSQEMIHHASRANQLFLYRSAVAADRDDPTDQLGVDTVTAAPDILHPAGDFAVFVYYEIPKPTNKEYHRIQKIVGYYLDANAGEIGPIKRITIDLSRENDGTLTPNDQVLAYDTVTGNTMVEKVVSDNWTNAKKHTKYDQFVLSARGLFETELSPAETVGRLFYFRDEHISMMVAGQIYGSFANTKLTATGSKNRMNYTDSFNFSVTPRS